MEKGKSIYFTKDEIVALLMTLEDWKEVIEAPIYTRRMQKGLETAWEKLEGTKEMETKCNIEVQRSDNDNHLKRARFNAASITVKASSPGDRFEEVIELYIVYISEFDFLNKNKTIYHVEKILRETGDVIDDGSHEIFVNTVIDDGTDVADLMACFTKKEVKNSKFPALSSEVKRLKETEGGAQAV